MTTISGLDGRGYRNLGSTGTPPVDSEWRTVVRKSSGPLRPWRRLRARRTASLRDSGWSASPQRHQLVPGGVHEVDVLGQRLAHRLGQRLAAPVGHQPAADLVLDLLAQLVDARLVLVAQQPLLERGEPVDPLPLGVARPSRRAAPVPGLVHQALQHPVEVEVPQRAVEVVRAAHRPARPPCRRSGPPPGGPRP